MTSAPRVIHRICASCDTEITEALTHCPKCGTKLVEIRDEADNVIGTVIDGRFEVRDKLGQGGMGTVYRAWQRSVGREVAVKLMDRSYSREPMGVRRFLREARLASQLSHPNTVSVFDFGQAEDGRLFIAMELIRGRTLHDLVKADGAFPVERVVRIGIQICDALEAAHAIGIVHRDMKLENVIVLDHPPGRDLLKVLDFGLAKQVHDPGSRATESGIVVGTPRYMSPEAATGGAVLPAGDLYSLGVILGELATGKPLFDGESLPQLVGQKMDPADAINRAPNALRPVLHALLDPDPDQRPAAGKARGLLTAVPVGDAGETLVYAEPEAGATTNLRGKTPPRSERAKSPVAFEQTRELTPGRLARSAGERPSAPPAASLPGSSQLSPSMLEVTKPPARKLLPYLVAAGAAAAVVIAIIVFVATRGGESSTRATVMRDAGAIATAPTDAAEEPRDAISAAQPLPAYVKVRIVSVPAGATVTFDQKPHKTPVELELPRQGSRIELVAKLKGYKDAPVSFVPDHDQEVPVTLTKRAAAKKSGGDETIPF